MRIALSPDTATNIAFGLFMAVLGLVAVYQGARYAARHIESDLVHISELEAQPALSNMEEEDHARSHGLAVAGTEDAPREA